MRYVLHLSTQVKGFGKPVVEATEAGICGHLDEAGKLVRPDRESVRAALPHRYRKAWDRCLGFWYDHYNQKHPAYANLYTIRGRYLNTIYAIPIHDSNLEG